MDGWKQNEPLAPHTTLQIGGPAEFFIEVKTEEDLAARACEANARGLKVTVLGGGSNVLVADEGIRGAVIKNAIHGIIAEENGNEVLLTAGAGEVFDHVVAHTVACGYWGIENLSHIPGSIGATPVQNVGAYGVEIGEYIETVRVYDIRNDNFKTLSAAECRFGYRDSLFKHAEGKQYIVTNVTLRLLRVPKPRLQYKDLATRFGESIPTQAEIRDAVIEIRSHKFPDWHTTGTAGSFFKNPVIPKEHYADLLEHYPELPGFPAGENVIKVPLGWILDKVCAVRGVQRGNVGTYEGQALVLVNHGGASAHEIIDFADEITMCVRERTKITIEWEVTRVS